MQFYGRFDFIVSRFGVFCVVWRRCFSILRGDAFAVSFTASRYFTLFVVAISLIRFFIIYVNILIICFFVYAENLTRPNPFLALSNRGICSLCLD